MILVTGGSGFIGSNFIRDWLSRHDEPVVNLDKLTYAGNPLNLSEWDQDPRYRFVPGDVTDRHTLTDLLGQTRPRAILHLAAETHVDRSIAQPAPFVFTNVVGTYTVLEAVRHYWSELQHHERKNFRLVHVSTDEVFGSLTPAEAPFTESSPYAPNSPYSASKAGADHLARAYSRTYHVPVVVTHASSNYGPFQFPEKLIPLLVVNALNGRPLPLYGDGQNVRDWLYVEDHCRGLAAALDAGIPGAVYNFGGMSERSNLTVAEKICDLVDARRPRPGEPARRSLIRFVADRPGHDRRYALSCKAAAGDLGWTPTTDFEQGLAATVDWYLDHPDWLADVVSGDYRRWIEAHYPGLALTT